MKRREPRKNQPDFDAAVIGAGPGGLVSALYLSRFLRSTVLISAGSPRASWIPRTHNLLGFQGGISGVELLKRLQTQLSECQVERRVGFARVHPEKDFFRIEIEGEEGAETLTARKVILSPGMTDVQPPLENLDQLRRCGLLRYCPVCDAFEYRGKKVAVLAQDEHGIKTAHFLSRFGKEVHLLWPPSVPLPKELETACADFKICVHRGVLQSANERKARGLELKFENRKLVVDACYVALGSTVNDLAFRHLEGIERTEEGYLVADSHMQLGIPGLYAVGDCVEGLAQIAVAAGQAAIAATHAHNEMREPLKRSRRPKDKKKRAKKREVAVRNLPSSKREPQLNA